MAATLAEDIMLVSDKAQNEEELRIGVEKLLEPALQQLGVHAEPLKNWAEVLAALEYSGEAVEITRVDIEAITERELAGTRWRTLHSPPDAPGGPAIDLSDETIRGAIKDLALEYAEQLCVEAGYAAGFKGDVYGALMRHVRERFLGTSLGLADRENLLYAWKMMPQVRDKVKSVPGLVAGMIQYASK